MLMRTLTEHIRRKQASLTSSRDLFKNEDGAIDLASIMVGIIVMGLIGGIIAATVFTVIPWTQDNSAKQQLDSIVSAESAYMGFSSATPSPLAAGYIPNSYADSAALAQANLLATNSRYCVITINGGKGYQGFAASSSGKIWTVTSTESKPVQYNQTLPIQCAGMTANPPSVNTTSRVRFGVTTPNGPLSNETQVVANETNEFPSIVSNYKDWTTSFSSAEVNTVYASGAQPMITWEPWVASAKTANQPNYTLASIYNGQHDAYIQTWIDAIKVQNTPKPILLRFAHEMTGDWYPWGYNVNGNVAGTYDSVNKRATGDYAKAWRYIHDKFTAAGIDKTKVQWVFAPNNSVSSGVDFWNFWPGADYVDYTGLDGFNWGTTQTWSSWQQPWDVFGAGLWHLNNDKDIAGKPIIITEVATVQSEGSNKQSEWINNLVNWLSTDAANQNVVGFVYFNHNKVEGSTMTDWRFDTTSDSVTAMKTSLANRPK